MGKLPRKRRKRRNDFDDDAMNHCPECIVWSLELGKPAGHCSCVHLNYVISNGLHVFEFGMLEISYTVKQSAIHLLSVSSFMRTFVQANHLYHPSACTIGQGTEARIWHGTNRLEKGEYQHGRHKSGTT